MLHLCKKHRHKVLRIASEHVKLKCFASTSWSSSLAVPWIICSKQEKIPFTVLSKQIRYIFWHQGCQTCNYDVETFVFSDDNWSCSWSGVGAPRPSQLGTWTSFSNINGCQKWTPLLSFLCEGKTSQSRIVNVKHLTQANTGNKWTLGS